MSEEPKPKRPKGVTIIAIFFIINGIWVAVTTTGGFGLPSTFFENLYELPLEESTVWIYSIVSAFIGFAIAISLLSGKRWARTIVIILSIIFIVVGSVIFLFQGGISFVEIILGALILYYVRKPHVKEYFGINK